MRKILYADDDALNREILRELLSDGGYDVVEADDGDTALQRLRDTSGIEAILLDRMMPRMSGIEVLKAVKADARLADIPVIMQTAATARDQILQGINAGVYYYLTKPYEYQTLLAIVGAALKDAAQKQRLREELAQHRSLMGLLEQARFRFRTPQEARSLAFLIANCFPEPEAAIYGLHEMLSNAIEHGNLGITYEEKTRLILDGRLREEIERRLDLPEHSEKWAWLNFETDGKMLRARIRDQGDGFDWRPFLDISPERATHPHGRGIATARRMSFSSLDYVGCGNEVVCTFVIDDDA